MRVMQAHRQMELDGERITAQGVINRYLGRDTKPVIMLLDLFREHNEKCAKLSGNGMAPGTVERYATSYKHTAAFIAQEIICSVGSTSAQATIDGIVGANTRAAFSSRGT